MTYKKIQQYVKNEYGFTPKTCWIAHVKQLCGLSVRNAWNRNDKKRKNPCPEDKLPAIKQALNHFGFLNKKLTK